jgi:hypothetical protein
VSTHDEVDATLQVEAQLRALAMRCSVESFARSSGDIE